MSRNLITFVVVLAAFLVVFPNKPDSHSLRAATPAATSTQPSPTTLTLEGADGATLQADYYAAPQPPAPTLLLVNLRHLESSWAVRWNALGYNVVAMDPRDIMSGDAVELALKSVGDIVKAMQFLSTLSATPHQVAVLGGSFYGAEALVACAKSPDCQTAILLSATDYKADLDDPIATLGKRPLFIAVSQNEGIIAYTDLDYANRALGPHQIIVYDGGVHATGLLTTHPELVDKIGDWLLKYLPLNAPSTSTP